MKFTLTVKIKNIENMYCEGSFTLYPHIKSIGETPEEVIKSLFKKIEYGRVPVKEINNENYIVKNLDFEIKMY